MGNTLDTAPTSAPATDWDALSKTYANLQKQAWASQDVSTEQVEDLRSQIDAYVATNVTDAAKQKEIAAKLKDDLDAMATATEKYEKDGSKSDKSWDAARVDLEDILNEIAPEGAEAVYSPVKLGFQANSHLAIGSAATDASSGLTMVPLEDIIARFPQLGQFKEIFEKAGAAYNIPPQLLAAQAMQESHGNPDESNGGMMQFIPSTWAWMGDASIPHDQLSSANVEAQVMAAAKYDAHELEKAGGDYDKMLRVYNGPVENGGTPLYQQQIKKWLIAKDGYME